MCTAAHRPWDTRKAAITGPNVAEVERDNGEPVEHLPVLVLEVLRRVEAAGGAVQAVRDRARLLLLALQRRADDVQIDI